MIFPKQDAIYQNLNSSFTNFGELLVDLKENGFTGVVQVSYWEYEGILLLDGGNIINAIEDINGKIITGPEAVNKVTTKAKEKDGAISVFVLKGEMITMLASVAKSEVIYENLSSDFTSLEALLSKLQKEDHTGYIEVKFEGNQQAGYIFLLAGRVIETLMSNRGDEISGANVLPRVIEFASSMGANFSVYKAAVEDALSESEMIKVSFNLPQLLEVWGAVISAVESASNGLLGDNAFLNAFKDTLIAKANDYPFLDPFAAKFQYLNGEVTFTGEVEKNFSQAVGEGLRDTVENLAEQAALDGNDLFGRIRTALDPVKVDFQDQIDRFDLGGILPDLFE
ncbi:MAG: hypothetical protein MUO54_08195 [Anaerolineales bacterium]|nr:hypothetical protein [Anaerolineales bacterium]